MRNTITRNLGPKDQGVEMGDLQAQRTLVDDLAKMAVIDILSGNEDRHLGNFKIYEDANGQKRALGIDNDSALSLFDTNTPNNKRFGMYNRKLEASFPIVSREIHDAVVGMNTEDYRNYLRIAFADQPRGEERVEAAVVRLRQMQEYFQDPTRCTVVDSYQTADISPLLQKQAYASESPFSFVLSDPRICRIRRTRPKSRL
jgi:hypothetical protein